MTRMRIGCWRGVVLVAVCFSLLALLGVTRTVVLAQTRTASPSDFSSQRPADLATNGTLALPNSTNAPATNAAGIPRGDSVKLAGGYSEIGFDKLSAFPLRVIYETVNPATLAYTPKVLGDIPPTILGLDGKKVAVKGFMLPLKEAEGFVTEFLLLKDQSMCCFGLSPKANEWIQVQMTGKSARSLKDVPVVICGTLHVGEFKQSPQMAGVYRLDGDKLIKPVVTP